MEAVMVFATILSPVILALVQLVKTTVKLPNNYLPLVALVIGLLVGLAAQPFTDLDLVLRLWAGGIAGLSATGLYEVATKRDGYTK